MKKADDMILLGLLYNKIEEKVNSAEVEDIFIEKANALYKQGQITKESLKDALYTLVPKARKEQIEKYQSKGKTKNASLKKAENIVDKVLSDDANFERERVMRERTERTVSRQSPCDIGDFGRSCC